MFLTLLNFLARLIIITPLFISYSQPALSATSITISDNLVLKAVNDKSVGFNFFSTSNKIDLPQGKHTLLVKYKDVFEDLDFAEERLIESEKFIIKLTLTNEKSLSLSTPKIKNLAEAEGFSNRPEIILNNSKGNPLVIELVKYDDYKLAQQVNSAVNDLVTSPLSAKEVASENIGSLMSLTEINNDSVQNSLIAASNTTVNQHQDRVNKDPTFNNKVTSHIKTMSMLKYWWKKATEQEKQNFVDFIENQ